MCAAIMLTLKNLCNIYEFDFIWSILKKPFNVMRNILDDCNDMFAALRATAVLRQLFTWYLKHRKNCECCPGHYLFTSVTVVSL